MTSDARAVLTGGCQCGAIRFALSAPPIRVSICHCRMCQKATGAPFASLAEISLEHFQWMRGQPALFRSSSIAERGYCRECGTPLSFHHIDGRRIEIMTGAFDRPDRVVPIQQFGTESRLGLSRGGVKERHLESDIREIRYVAHRLQHNTGAPLRDVILIMVRMLMADDARHPLRSVVFERGMARQIGDRHHPAEP